MRINKFLLILFLLLISVNVYAVQQQICEDGVCADFNVNRDGLQIKLTCKPIDGTFYFYGIGDISIVQNGDIVGVNPFGSTKEQAEITCAGMSMCYGDVNQGVTLYVTIKGFPDWFDIKKAFLFYYKSNAIIFDAVVITTTTTTTGSPKLPSCAAEAVLAGDPVSIAILRRFRDEVLSQTPRGRENIVLYYELSPVLVEILKSEPELKEKLREYFYKIEPVIREQIGRIK